MFMYCMIFTFLRICLVVCSLQQDEVDVFVLSKITDVLHAFFTTHNTSFLPVFDKVMPCFVKMLVGFFTWVTVGAGCQHT